MFGFRFKATWPFITRQQNDVMYDSLEAYPEEKGTPNIHQQVLKRHSDITKVSAMSQEVLKAQLEKHKSDAALGLDTTYYRLLENEVGYRVAAVQEYLDYLDLMSTEQLQEVIANEFLNSGTLSAKSMFLSAVRRLRLEHAFTRRHYHLGDFVPEFSSTTGRILTDDLLMAHISALNVRYTPPPTPPARPRPRTSSTPLYDKNKNGPEAHRRATEAAREATAWPLQDLMPAGNMYHNAPAPAPSNYSGGGGTFDGAGASGDWTRPASESYTPSYTPDTGGCSGGGDSGGGSCSSD